MGAQAGGVLFRHRRLACDRLMWAEDDPDWNEYLDQHLLGGLTSHDAQTFLAKCGIGPPPEQPTSPLQQAIIKCCDTEPESEVSCHPLYLALCAEIVLNTRKAEGRDPAPETFMGIPTPRVASELATRFSGRSTSGRWSCG